MVRYPAFAGQFYESDKKDLQEQIKGCFLSSFGPGKLPEDKSEDKSEGKIKAIISPHAGYVFSGPCAAFGYNAIAESLFPEIFLILGPSHMGSPTCLSDEDWITPLGTISNNSEMTRTLSNALQIPIQNISHEIEHSIEVQLPFLQFIAKNRKFSIIPLIVSSDTDPIELGKKLRKELENYHLLHRTTIIVSSDFTHYGPNYDYVPFNEHIESRLKELDSRAIDYIKNMDPKGFSRYVDDTRATICGKLPIEALLSILHNTKVELLKYYNSGDILGDYNNTVSYSSIVFR